MSGPIERKGRFADQLKGLTDIKVIDRDRISLALTYMVWGYFLKLVVADRLALVVNQIHAAPECFDIIWLIGGAIFFKRMFGTKLYLGEPDARNYREHPELSLVQDSGSLAHDVFEVDHEITDGEAIRFGNTEILFYLVPGHTDGVISAFFDVSDGNSTLRAGYYGGFGFNTLQKSYLDDIGDTKYEMRKTYLKSLDKVRNQHVDLFLGNHCVNNDTLGRARRLKDGDRDAFIDDRAWGEYLDSKRDALLELMADPNQN